MVSWKDVAVPRPYPQEFRDDVVRVARDREPGVTIEQIAKDFGVHPMTLFKWLRQAEIDEGAKPGVSRASRLSCASASADQAAGAGERGPAPGDGVSVAGESAGKRLYPLVSELAADGIPVAVTCRVLEDRSTAVLPVACPPGHRRRARRGVPGERAVRRPPRRSGVRLPVPGRRGPRRRACRWRIGPRGGSARPWAGGARSARNAAGTARRPVRRSTTTWSARDFTATAPNRLWLADIERHEALLNRVEVGDLHRRVVAAAR